MGESDVPVDDDGVQCDADSYRDLFDHADDGHDANPGTYPDDGEPNGEDGDEIPSRNG